MAPHEIKTVGVIATGVIGSSFIALFLARGLHVIACSTSANAEEKLKTYLARIWPTLDPATLAPGASLENYKFVGETLDGYYDQVDFVQENAPERPALKHALLAALDAALPAHVPIASSSSGLPATVLIAQCTHNPERILIGHPFNPPHIVPLVEVVPHPGTSQEIIDRTMAFYESVGRKPVLVRKETPGFIANRLQVAVMKEANSLVLQGICTAEEIDTVMTESLGPRWALTGPFMTSVLGGGGTVEGWRRIMQYIAPAAKVWNDDMKAHEYDFDPKHLPTLDASVQEMLKGKDMEGLVKQRDQLLNELLRKKEEAGAALKGNKIE